MHRDYEKERCDKIIMDLGTLTLERIMALSACAENNCIEYKKTTGQLERGMETLCAFLNGKGGVVLFGIEDNRSIKGQLVSDTIILSKSIILRKKGNYY